MVFRGSFTLEELPTSPLEGPVVSQILPIIPSIQPISSHAPGDRDYQFYTQPIWEPSQKSTPFWEYTSPQKPFSSDMDNPSPTTTDDSGMPGDEIPSTMDFTYVSRNASIEVPPLVIKHCAILYPPLFRPLSGHHPFFSIRSHRPCHLIVPLLFR